jgi:hypothetical protein
MPTAEENQRRARELTDKLTRLIDDYFPAEQYETKALIAMVTGALYSRHGGLNDDQTLSLFREAMAAGEIATIMTANDDQPPDPLADYDRLIINRASQVTEIIDNQGGNNAFKATVAMVAAVRYCRRLRGPEAATQILTTATYFLDRQQPKKKKR